MIVRINSTMTHSKNFCKCHNVPPEQQYYNKEMKKEVRYPRISDHIGVEHLLSFKMCIRDLGMMSSSKHQTNSMSWLL
jgi:hypothetical protein